MTLTMSNRTVLSEFEQVLEGHAGPSMCLFESTRIVIKRSSAKEKIMINSFFLNFFWVSNVFFLAQGFYLI